MADHRKSRAKDQTRHSAAWAAAISWRAVAATIVVVVLAAGLFGYVLKRSLDESGKTAALARFEPSSTNQDPSRLIPGVTVRNYPGGAHVRQTERVAYDQAPPFGGPHDGNWAACDGVVYERPVRSENMVHSLEHGAVWIAYDPERLSKPDVAALKDRVQGQDRMLMSPYPNLDAAVSLQSWGHQLKVDSVRDERIDQFVRALRGNPYTHPEVGASCAVLGPGAFDPEDPPPFDPRPPGPNAVPVTQFGVDTAPSDGGTG